MTLATISVAKQFTLNFIIRIFCDEGVTFDVLFAILEIAVFCQFSEGTLKVLFSFLEKIMYPLKELFLRPRIFITCSTVFVLLDHRCRCGEIFESKCSFLPFQINIDIQRGLQ